MGHRAVQAQYRAIGPIEQAIARFPSNVAGFPRPRCRTDQYLGPWASLEASTASLPYEPGQEASRPLDLPHEPGQEASRPLDLFQARGL